MCRCKAFFQKKHADNEGDDRNKVDIGGGFRCGKLGNAVIIKAVAKQADNNAQIKNGKQGKPVRNGNIKDDRAEFKRQKGEGKIKKNASEAHGCRVNPGTHGGGKVTAGERIAHSAKNRSEFKHIS